MHILILVGKLTRGGGEKQAVMDANILSEKNLVHLITYQEGELQNLLSPAVRLHVLPLKGYRKKIKHITHFVKDNQIDVLHGYLMGPLLQSAMAGRNANVPVIWHIHSHLYELNFVSRLLFRWISGFDAIKRIAYVNRELRHYFETKLRFPDNKGTVLYNSSTMKYQSLNAQKKKLIIGFVGRLIPLKRVHYLIDLAASLKEYFKQSFAIWIIGDGDLKEELEQMVYQRGLTEYIEFKGFHHDVAPFYEQFDLFILPSREECLSLALIDAGLAGIPSIAFQVGGNDEIICDKETGFIVSEKEELFNKCQILLEESNLRKKMGKKAANHCKQHFTSESHSRALDGIYKEINVS